MFRKIVLIILSILYVLLYHPHSQAFASELLLRRNMPVQTNLYFTNVAQIPDPSIDNRTIYAYLGTSYAADSYSFIPSQNASVSIEVLVPARTTNTLFKPGWEIVGANIPPQDMNIYFSIPLGSNDTGHDYYINSANRPLVSDALTMERLFLGNQQVIKVLKDKLYFINVYDPFHYTGEYVLKIGNKPDIAMLRQKSYWSNLYTIKTNQLGRQIDWHEMIATFMVMLGLSIGFGPSLAHSSLLVIRKKSEQLPHFMPFTAGNILLIVGLAFLYRASWFSGIALLQLITWEASLVLYVLLRQTFGKQIKVQAIVYVFLSLSIILQLFLFTWYLFVTR